MSTLSHSKQEHCKICLEKLEIDSLFHSSSMVFVVFSLPPYSESCQHMRLSPFQLFLHLKWDGRSYIQENCLLRL